MRKAHEEVGKGARVVALVPARTDTTWWHDYCIQYEIRFIKGRLKFGNSKNSAPFPSALIIMLNKKTPAEKGNKRQGFVLGRTGLLYHINTSCVYRGT